MAVLYPTATEDSFLGQRPKSQKNYGDKSFLHCEFN